MPRMSGVQGSIGEVVNDAKRGLSARTATYVKNTPISKPKYTDVMTVKSFFLMNKSISIADKGIPIIVIKTTQGTQSGADLTDGELKIRTAIPRETMQNSVRRKMRAIGCISLGEDEE
jgi:hypothetical protein